jgi:hypothetical protein
VEIPLSYDEIARRWANADDRDEASILDSIPATSAGLADLFDKNAWAPSPGAWYRDERVHCEEDKRSARHDLPTALHPTSRARIHALKRYLDARAHRR